MNVHYSPRFVRDLKKCPKPVRILFRDVLALMMEDIRDPALRLHPLRGLWRGYWSLDVTEDYRALFTIEQGGEQFRFHTIGTHDVLYG